MRAFCLLLVLGLSATCFGSVLVFGVVVLCSLYQKYVASGVELFATYAVALTVPMTLLGIVFAASVGTGIWSARRLFKQDGLEIL